MQLVQLVQLVVLLAELQLPQSWVQTQHSQRRCRPTAAHSFSCARTNNVCHAPSLKSACMLHLCTLNQCMSSMQGLYQPCQLCFEVSVTTDICKLCIRAMHDCCHDVTLPIPNELSWRSMQARVKAHHFNSTRSTSTCLHSCLLCRTTLSVIQLVMFLTWTSKAGCMAQLQSVDLKACLHQKMTQIVQSSHCHRVHTYSVCSASGAPLHPP